MSDNFTIRCQNCSFSHLCIPVSLDQREMASLDDIIQRKRPLHKNDKLTEPEMPFTSLYAVRSGSFKSYIMAKDGEQQITGFHLPGDIIGFDALRNNEHQSFTQAMETSMVCEIPYQTLDQISAQLPTLRRQMMTMMSTEIKQDHDLMMLLNKRNAEERLSHFLLNLSQRFAARGFSAQAFNLTMTRNEIGNYLGLTVETVSRLLSRFQKEGLIHVDGKLIEILDQDALKQKLSEHKADLTPCHPKTVIADL
ncbi:fumarate/nitrate reduction transcriptional regulator Fnr [Aestuariibacter halophilus]|uniref:Fumarate/nitrate reduction transcriptional regulator Fnr n=1 Tax=Fluctibacter halophilus TaxID=226011 RepID=A0ABS8G6K0_9ALTE|nr:fumarate/nitrate reduction transcriptional regulator Fnr [Aestuariibacter halophilus]MCC2615711.1 fumarate/nitrate reduction transcriptional regulator Fnr [Aestuariibacter halophilus]